LDETVGERNDIATARGVQCRGLLRGRTEMEVGFRGFEARLPSDKLRCSSRGGEHVPMRPDKAISNGPDTLDSTELVGGSNVVAGSSASCPDLLITCSTSDIVQVRSQTS